jgi:hypothetical protein
MCPFNIIRNTLALNLQKQGHTLADFESALSRLDTGEGVADVVKMASSVIPDPVSSSLNLASSVYFPTTMAAGALVGLGVDKAEGTVKKQNRKLNELRQNIKMLKNMKNQAEIEHHLNGH